MDSAATMPNLMATATTAAVADETAQIGGTHPLMLVKRIHEQGARFSPAMLG
ncbi:MULTISPECIES: hypothetical protein [Aminobacter]|uniref:Uncharacterized protein n=1 Tax=Aminobacter ciceronei TaxID=150723 RepID=A0ABR6C2Z9_9HYPH|nr:MULTISPECIES: hypothetical protein [Aminobacter]MBA8905356.1 hypothetical protein [Aminobacter ciceronei]MBA9019344.1 hypothetical protein [Aminobacter ciceronei]WMC99126.1 hypothetical protein RAR13_10705 [Aminobacter aminovorans]BBD37422.1 hypothetical protein Amn_23020 [Aminobacter sp. SS-2016]